MGSPALALIVWLLFWVGPLMADDQSVRIGVLSHRGNLATLSSWSPTADYLSQTVPGFSFEIIPLDFDEVDPAVKFGQVDFILVNPGIYVNLEVRYRISRIATLSNRAGGGAHNVFGGVIFSRRDRDDINTLEDVRGKRFMAVDYTSLGGFEMAWREFKDVGIDPYRDFRVVEFGGIHDRVVRAVRDGVTDVGTVRTDILERMQAAGDIDLDDFKIINRKVSPGFLLARSTRLYPEWPFSKVLHTSNGLAQKVAVALLNMPRGHPAANAGNYDSWTIPLDYQSVHDLFKALQLPPYEALGRFTLQDAVDRYWYWLVAGVVFLLSMVFMTTWVVRLNRELKKSKSHLERQHELILNSVADGIFGVDLQGNTTFANRALTRITGWEPRDLIGFNQHEILHHTYADGSPHPPEHCPVYATCRDSVPRYISDDVFWRKDGSAFPVEYSTNPIRNDLDQLVGSVVVFRDISERKRAAEQARQHQDDLAHVARLSTMGEMASGIAHEINQPLTAIATNAQASVRMLESSEQSRERVIDVLERIGTQAERAGEIIRHLRQFVKKEPLELSLVNVNDVINEVILLLQPEIKKAGVRIKLDLAEDIGRVMAQHVQLDQVILNLMRNAIEAMSDIPEGERLLTLSSRREEGNYLSVTVADSGPGLQARVIPELFNPFVTTKVNGMGLGLSISKGIIEAHKGKIFQLSEPGQGARFKFTLPIETPENNDNE